MFFVLSLIGVCVGIKEKVWIRVSVSASGDLDFRAIFFFFFGFVGVYVLFGS